MTTLILPADLRAQIEGAAAAAVPRECCGLIAGVRDADTIRATDLHPAANLAPDTDRFEIAPADHFRALHAARLRGTAIVGCYHSHPGGRAQPSPRDREGAAEAGFVWLIAVPGGDGVAELAAYVFDGTGFLPVLMADAPLA